MAEIGDYLQTIAGNCSFTNQYFEGTQNETNLDLSGVTIADVVFYYRNIETFAETLNQGGKIQYGDYPLAIEIMQIQPNLDDKTIDLGATYETLKGYAREVVKRIFDSVEFQQVEKQNLNQTYDLLLFRDQYDEIMIGVQITGTFRLNLNIDNCV